MYGMAQIKVQAAPASQRADNPYMNLLIRGRSSSERLSADLASMKHVKITEKPVSVTTEPQLFCVSPYQVWPNPKRFSAAFDSQYISPHWWDQAVFHRTRNQLTNTCAHSPPTSRNPSPPMPGNWADYLQILGIYGLSSHRLTLTTLSPYRAPTTHPAHPTHLHFTPFWASPFSPWPPLPSPPPLCTAASWRPAQPGRRSASSGCSCGRGDRERWDPGPAPKPLPPPQPRVPPAPLFPRQALPHGGAVTATLPEPGLSPVRHHGCGSAGQGQRAPQGTCPPANQRAGTAHARRRSRARASARDQSEGSVAECGSRPFRLTRPGLAPPLPLGPGGPAAVRGGGRSHGGSSRPVRGRAVREVRTRPGVGASRLRLGPARACLAVKPARESVQCWSFAGNTQTVWILELICVWPGCDSAVPWDTVPCHEFPLDVGTNIWNSIISSKQIHKRQHCKLESIHTKTKTVSFPDRISKKLLEDWNHVW